MLSETEVSAVVKVTTEGMLHLLCRGETYKCLLGEMIFREKKDTGPAHPLYCG